MNYQKEENTTESPFSALDLRDHVVIMLLFDQIITERQVAEVWDVWKRSDHTSQKEPLWRMLTLFPEVNRELVFAEAARVYGIEEARIDHRMAVMLIKEFEKRCSKSLWQKLMELRLVPVAEMEQHQTNRRRTIFVSHDPTNPEVEKVLRRLNVGGYELRFVQEIEIIQLLSEVFPWQFKALYKTLLENRTAWAEQYAARKAAEQQSQPVERPEATQEQASASDASPVPKQEEARSSSEILRLFEELLVEIIRREATGACVLPNTKNYCEIYFIYGETLEPWQVVPDTPARLFIETIKNGIKKTLFLDHEHEDKEALKRWVNSRIYTYRLAFSVLNKEVDQEAIVVRVVR